MIAESGESGVSQRSRCAAVRKNATFRAEFSAVLQNVAKKYRLFGKASRGLGSGQRTTMSSLGTANTAISSVLSYLTRRLFGGTLRGIAALPPPVG